MISEVAQLEMVYQHNSKMNQSHCPGLDWFNWICRENHKYFSPTASRICKCSIRQNSVFFRHPVVYKSFLGWTIINNRCHDILYRFFLQRTTGLQLLSVFWNLPRLCGRRVLLSKVFDTIVTIKRFFILVMISP